MHKSCLILLCFVALQSRVSTLETDEVEATAYMSVLDESYTYQCNKEMEATWSYITNVENETAEAEANDADVEYFQFQSEAAKNVSLYDYASFSDVELYRMFRFQADAGPGALDEESLTMYQELQSGMENIYSTATICSFEDPSDCSLTLEPDLEQIMATSTDFDELKYVWEQWRNVSGRLMREDFIDFVALSNEAAVLDGYSDTTEYWLNGYTVTEKEVDGYGKDLVEIDQEKFKDMIQDVWEDVFENLYKQLHAFVRMKLKDVYPEYIDLRKAIPANVLGNMWAQDWTNIAQYVMPFEDQPDFDVTQSMINNNWDIDQMFESAEDFFTSIGLYRMTDDFWDKSVINQTAWNKTIICHASAEDFCLGTNSTDFRIKMCTEVNMNDLVTVHHEMGHIEYFMSYRDQPHVFRDAANPGFHEAIGDLIALSVSTPTHMENVLGLTSTLKDTKQNIEYSPEDQRDLNFLMRMALEKIAFLPFGYLIDKYRWGIFDGSISTDHLNSEWWNYREDYQGVIPPSNLTRGERFFDAGAKYHIPANVPYIRYFVSFIVQFDFHKTLCNASGHEGDLHKCDIYNNTVAGNILGDSMMEGFSRPWPMILNELGGTMEMNADAIKEYFQPLMDFLEIANEGQLIGWESQQHVLSNKLAEEYLNMMEENITDYAVQVVDAAYLYNTNVTDYNANAMNEASLTFSQVYRSWWDNLLLGYYYDGITDPFLQRQFQMQQSIGTAILEEEQYNELNEHINAMMKAYGNKVCPFEDMKCEDSAKKDINWLELQMGTNKEYSQLLYYWEEWRDVSGKVMIEDFKAYVDLMNIAAVNNSFQDAGEMWLEPYTTYTLDTYTSDEFKIDVESIWQELSPYYHKLHGYVRYKLLKNENYKKYINDDNLIPAHILGNMWAQSWENIYDMVAPYPEVPLLDITETLEQESDPEEMFRIAENFFTSIGLFDMTEDFWNNSMREQPTDGREVVCHPSAWDFLSTEIDNTQDGRYRIKMCTKLNQEDFIVIHHEMGHVQYFMSYSNDMPLIYRSGANPGFHEAIGDTIALSVSTPSHLLNIEDYILNRNETRVIETEEVEEGETSEQDINFLMKQALSKIAFLPYAYILDQFRWKVFSGEVVPDEYNRAWWEMRIDYQGLRPPIDRSAKMDFDAGSKFHVPGNVPYIRYFVAYILQFQFHEKLCSEAQIGGSIYNCDIYGNEDAGDALKELLSKGASEHWQDQLADFLGTNGNMDASKIIEYFQPLWTFLDNEIAENSIDIEWAASKDVINDFINESETISSIVPIIVGVVLAVLVSLVIIAFFVGQKRRKKKEAKAEAEKKNGQSGYSNGAMEMSGNGKEHDDL